MMMMKQTHKNKYGFHAKIRYNFPDISYLSEVQKINYHFLNKIVLFAHLREAHVRY